VLAELPGREQQADAAAQEKQRATRAAHGGSRLAVTIGRNDPSPVRQRAEVQALLRGPMTEPTTIPPRLRVWIQARRRHHLSHAQVQMARELGMNPTTVASDEP
jgi:hypothetical protein